MRFNILLLSLVSSVPSSTAARNAFNRPNLNAELNIVTVSAPSVELAAGYLRWLHLHPDRRPGSGSPLSQPGGAAGTAYQIKWPSLDIYSRNGDPLYHSNDSAMNIAVISHLPLTAPHLDQSSAKERPSLQETVTMFHEIPASALDIPPSIHYVIVVIDYSARPACAAQNQAIQELKKRIAGSVYRLIEVHLT